MLKLLLDEHLSPELARPFLSRRPTARIVSVLEWEDGRWRSADDEWLLQEAHRAGWTLVTFDQATIPPILQEWGLEERSHSGVVFLDDRRFPQADLGRMLKALVHLWDNYRNRDWT